MPHDLPPWRITYWYFFMQWRKAGTLDRHHEELWGDLRQAEGHLRQSSAALLEWLGRNRRLSKDYEGLPGTGEAMIKLVIIHLMVRRATKKLAPDTLSVRVCIAWADALGMLRTSWSLWPLEIDRAVKWLSCCGEGSHVKLKHKKCFII